MKKIFPIILVMVATCSARVSMAQNKIANGKNGSGTTTITNPDKIIRNNIPKGVQLDLYDGNKKLVSSLTSESNVDAVISPTSGKGKMPDLIEIHITIHGVKYVCVRVGKNPNGSESYACVKE